MSVEFFIIEHPTQGVLSDESEPNSYYKGKARFRWHWSTPRGSDNDWKFATVEQAVEVIGKMAKKMGEQCYVLTSEVTTVPGSRFPQRWNRVWPKVEVAP